MKHDLAHQDVILELRSLTAEYLAMRALAHEADARGYEALYTSAGAADQVVRLCRRAVEAFEQVAFILLPIDDARDTRQQLLQTSRALASLVGEPLAAYPEHNEQESGLGPRRPFLRQLLLELDKAPCGQEEPSLHGRLLSAAVAASAGLGSTLAVKRPQAARRDRGSLERRKRRLTSTSA